ncbi:metallophosphoesterase [Fictibacillus arsenicus]|uniref:metallophosphoesterase n=1 Tax=Fictibacillus arsenicus TaxID=255247 RepID=UPI000984C008|nr:metallophosphoesterase [Fictibacillus arsenicus]
MDFFVIGDVHGCYHTFKNMINKYWNKENEMLIQLGDLIDRGRNSPQMVQLAMQLSTDFPDQVLFF